MYKILKAETLAAKIHLMVVQDVYKRQVLTVRASYVCRKQI